MSNLRWVNHGGGNHTSNPAPSVYYYAERKHGRFYLSFTGGPGQSYDNRTPIGSGTLGAVKQMAEEHHNNKLAEADAAARTPDTKLSHFERENVPELAEANKGKPGHVKAPESATEKLTDMIRVGPAELPNDFSADDLTTPRRTGLPYMPSVDRTTTEEWSDREKQVYTRFHLEHAPSNYDPIPGVTFRGEQVYSIRGGRRKPFQVGPDALPTTAGELFGSVGKGEARRLRKQLRAAGLVREAGLPRTG